MQSVELNVADVPAPCVTVNNSSSALRRYSCRQIVFASELANKQTDLNIYLVIPWEAH